MNITKLILPISIVFLVLFGCRQADVYEDISLQSSEKEKIEFFERFEKQVYGDSLYATSKLYNRGLSYRGGYTSDISYHLPFSEMIDNFMNNHPKFKQNFIKEIGNVSYRVYSKTYGYGPTSSKSMAFPIVYGGEVSGILLCYISPHRDTAEFVVLKNDDPKVSNLISVFQEALDASYPTLESIHSMGRDTRQIVDAGTIEEVVLYHHRKKDSSGGGGIVFNNWDWYKDYLMERYGQRIEIHGQYLRRGGAGQAMSGGSNKHKKMPDRIEGDEGDVQDKNPCEKIKSQTNDGAYKEKKKFLEGKLNNTSESGFRVGLPVSYAGQTGIQYQVLSNKPGTSELDFTIFNTTFGIMHTHYDGLYPMFSPGDIYLFGQLLTNAQNHNIPLSDVFLSVVTPAGNYQLRFEGTHFAGWNQGFDFDKLNADYIKALGYYDQGTQEKFEKGFLKFMKDKMNIEGAKLIKEGENGNTQLSLDHRGNLKTEDCN